MRILSLILLLTLSIASAQAQTSLRLNVYGPVPLIEQYITKKQSIEVAYSPRVFGREWINTISPFGAWGGKSLGNGRSSALTVTARSVLSLNEEGPFFGDPAGMDFSEREEIYLMLLFKRTVDSRSESYNRTGDDYVGTLKRTGTAFGVGFGGKTVKWNGFVIDGNIGLGFETVEKVSSGITFDDFYGPPNPAQTRTTYGSDIKFLFNTTFSIGYVFFDH